MTEPHEPLDAVDRALIGALRDSPRASMAELARRAGIARGTAYSRLDRLERAGVITGYGPDVDATQAGFGVVAFVTLQTAQGAHDETVTALGGIREVMEIHTVTGNGDLLCRVLARSNDDLHAVLLRMTEIPTVERSETQLALHTSLHRSAADLVADS